MAMTKTVGDGAAPQRSLTAAACLFHGFSDASRLEILRHLALCEHRVVFALAHPEALMDLLAAAERLLALTGDAVVLCPVYGLEGAAPASRTEKATR